MVLGGCRWFEVVAGSFRSFHVLVTTFSEELPRNRFLDIIKL